MQIIVWYNTFAQMKMMMMKAVYFAFFLFLFACNTDSSQPKNNFKANVNEPLSQDELVETGQSLFLQKCASCHAVNMNLTGPALKGVEKRWYNKEDLYAFIRNSQQIIGKDAYAKDLFESNHKIPMPPFTDLKDADITAILAYVKNASVSARH